MQLVHPKFWYGAVVARGWLSQDAMSSWVPLGSYQKMKKKKKGGSGQTQNYGIGSEEKMELDDHFDDFGHICRSYSNSFTCSHMNVNSFRTAPCATGSSSQAPSHLLLSSPRLISLWPCSRPSWFQYVLYRSISSMMRPLRRFSIVSRIETDDLSSQQQGLLCTERI